jgi:protein TonB
MLRFRAGSALLAFAFATCAAAVPPPAPATPDTVTPAPAADQSAPPRALSTPTPPMPRKELQAGHSGVVTLALRIDAAGKVADVGVAKSSGWPAIDESAVRTAHAWTFEPARNAAGEAIESRVQVPVSFRSEVPGAPTGPAGTTAKPDAKDYADAMNSMTEMTCAQFVERVDREQLTAKTVSDAVPQYKTLWGLLVALQMATKPAADVIAFLKLRDVAFDGTVSRCRATPDQQLRLAFGASMQAAITK